MYRPAETKKILRSVKQLSLTNLATAPHHIAAFWVFALALCTTNLYAHDGAKASSAPIKADSHAPIGVMGDHMHKTGEWMVSYRFMQMNMKGNILGSNAISPNDIVTNISNPNTPPATLRVTPTEMTTDMHMLGGMYAPNNSVTLIAMLNYLSKEMKHTTYQGMMGANVLGTFTTSTSGVGDTKIGALVRLVNKNKSKVHLNLLVSLPTGSIDEEAEVLTPMNMRATIRTPYGMQLGTGTYNLEPGVTYNGTRNKLRWGAQYKSIIHLSDNDQNYTIGDKQELTGWGSYLIANALSASVRLSYSDQDAIDGLDAKITAPVSTANPGNYGGKKLDAGIGMNYVAQNGPIRGHRFALEYNSTINQDVNGLQLEMQSMLTIGYQYAF